MTELYRHFDHDGKLLYVGISLSTVQRLTQHRQGSHWFGDIARIEVERFATREAAAMAEVEAIKQERPVHNIAWATLSVAAIKEPDRWDL